MTDASRVRLRRTLSGSTETFSGVGLHSGAAVSVRVLPAAPQTGIVFRDLASAQAIPARAEYVMDTSRCTILGNNGITVQTVEHLLSALSGLGIDDAVIETEGGELPAGDGSASPFAGLLSAAGVSESALTVQPLELSSARMVTGEDGASIVALPAKAFRATVVIDYPKHTWIGTQSASFDAIDDDYATEVAPARTYGFLSEIAWLQARGLALGASYETGVALREDGYDTALRFANELARHKLLDLIGDLSLIGRPLAAHVIAIKPSHTLNCRMARLLSSFGD